MNAQQVARRRFVQHILRVLEEDDDAGTAAEAHLRRGQLLRAWDRAIADDEHAVAFTLAIRLFCMRRSMWRAYYERSCLISPAAREAAILDDRMRLLVSVGQSALHLDMDDTALEFLRQVVDEPDAIDAGLRADALNNIGLVHSRNEDWATAVTYYRRALDHRAQHQPSRDGHAETLVNLADAYNRLGQPETALAHLVEAVGIAAELGDNYVEAAIWNKRGQILDDMGRYREAADNYERAVKLRRALADRRLMAASLSNLAMVRAHLGEYGAALVMLREVLDVEEHLPDVDLADTLSNLATLHLHLGEHDRALRYLERVAALEAPRGDPVDRATTLNNMGLALRDAGQFERARELFGKALELWHQVRHRRGLAITLANRAVADMELGDIVAAVRDLLRAQRIATSIQESAQLGIVLNDLGLALSRTSTPARALPFYTQAADLHAAAGNRFEQITTLVNMARLHHTLGDVDTACQVLGQAIDIGEQVDHPERTDHHDLLRQWRTGGGATTGPAGDVSGPPADAVPRWP